MIVVVGLGPGEKSGRTFAAQKALETCDVIAGYAAYIDLVKNEFPDKLIIETGMRGEVERCKRAIEASRAGQSVAMVCSGDAAVYGMASLLIELGEEEDAIEVVPGVTAALSASAVLGAPISGDCAIISLSDLLTPWAVIERRLKGAAMGDFVIALYNPSSIKRGDYLRRACRILLEAGRDGGVLCGWVRNIGREKQEMRSMTLNELIDEQVDMFTTVIIGNGQTIGRNGFLVTPRGYRK